jgi:hypothetical protein
MNDAPLMEAYAELRSIADAEHVPPRVKSALLGLSKCQTKLFCTVCVDGLAVRAPDGGIRLEPSDNPRFSRAPDFVPKSWRPYNESARAGQKREAAQV